MPTRKLLKKTLVFLIPHIIIITLFALLMAQTGEFLTASALFEKVHAKHTYIFGPHYTSRLHVFKTEGIKFIHPDVVVIGSSRTNQWRSATFKPYRFYNAGNAAFSIKAYQQTLIDGGVPKPRVVIFSLDFFDFTNTYPFPGIHTYHEVNFGAPFFLKALKGGLDDLISDPLSLIVDKDPIYSIPAYGLNAGRSGNGFRYDGSYQHGSLIKKYHESGTWYPSEELKADLNRISKGDESFRYADDLREDRLNDLKAFAAYAKKEGITLIAITSPFHPDFLKELNNSPHHKAWRKFNTLTFARWIEDQGIIYFNFSNIHSFGGRVDEFVDAVHPTESACIRMLLAMMKDGRVEALLPQVSTDDLKTALKQSDYPLETYKNKF